MKKFLTALLSAFLLSTAPALAQLCPNPITSCPSPTYNTLTANVLSARNGGTLQGNFAGAAILSGPWTFNGGLIGTLTGHSSLDLALTGGAVTGSTTFSASGVALLVTDSMSIGNALTISPAVANPLIITNSTILRSGSGNAALNIESAGNGQINFFTQGGVSQQFRISDTAAATSYLSVAGGGTGNGPTFSTVGSDTTANVNINAASGGRVRLSQNSGYGAVVNGILQYGRNQTFVNTAGIGNGSTNTANSWSNYQITGTLGAGASTDNFLQATDSTNAAASGMYLIGINLLKAAGWDGISQAFNVKTVALVPSLGTAPGPGVFGFYLNYGDPTHQISEGGTGNPNDLSTWKGYGVNGNIDLTCNVLYGNACEGLELDIRNIAPTFSKKIAIFSYSVNDAAHGLDDCAICIVSNSTVIGSGGGGIYAIEFSGYTNAWPLDPNRTDTVIMGEFPQRVGNVYRTLPNVAVAAYGYDFPGIDHLYYAWRTTGHWVDSVGQFTLGPGNFTYDQTGIYIQANGFTETGATVAVAGSGYGVGDQVYDPNGGQWQVLTVVGGTSPGGIATLGPLASARPGFVATCPATPLALSRGSGKNATINVTCSSAASKIGLLSPVTTTGISDSGGINTTAATGYRINGSAALLFNPSLGNVALGSSPFGSITTGQHNFFFTPGSSSTITTSSNNVVIGNNAGASITTCNGYDTAIGFAALQFDNGCENTAVGSNALNQVTTGLFNVGIGNDAGSKITTGSGNISMGHSAGNGSSSANPLTGNSNVSLGNSAGGYLSGAATANTYVGGGAAGGSITNQVTGNNNAGFGWGALANLSSGSNNTAIGEAAMVGSSISPITGSANVAVGNGALGAAQGAVFQNTAVGSNAGNSLTTGQGSTFVGAGAGNSGTGNNLTIVGANVAQSITTGQSDTIIGSSSSCTTPTATTSNYLALCTASTPLISVSNGGAPSASLTAISGGLQIGSQTALTVANGEFGLVKITAAGTAPGAAGGKMEIVCGTNAGTAKLIMYAGTSTTAATVLDNIGAGVSGC